MADGYCIYDGNYCATNDPDVSTRAFGAVDHPVDNRANMKMGARIGQRLAELGWQQADLIRRVPELEPATLSALIQRDSGSSKWSDQIARALGVEHSWLVHGHLPKLLAVRAAASLAAAGISLPGGHAPEGSSEKPVTAPLLDTQERQVSHGRGTIRHVPLSVGAVPVNLSVRFDSASSIGKGGEPATPGHITYPTADPSSYAVQCIDDGLAPRAEHGEFLIVSPETPVRAGDQVLLTLADGSHQAGVLLYERAGRLHLARVVARTEQLAPVPLSDVVTMHRIVGVASAELFTPR